MKTSSKVAMGVIAGAVAGTVATLLSAPKSGEETREELKHVPEKAKGQFFETLDHIKGKDNDVKKK